MTDEEREERDAKLRELGGVRGETDLGVDGRLHTRWWFDDGLGIDDEDEG